MNALASAALTAALGEITIGSSDIDARAAGVAACGKGNVIRGFQVLNGAGSLVYVDDRTGEVCTLTGLSSTLGDVEPQAGELAIRTIHVAGNDTPSAPLTLRCVW